MEETGHGLNDTQVIDYTRRSGLTVCGFRSIFKMKSTYEVIKCKFQMEGERTRGEGGFTRQGVALLLVILIDNARINGGHLLLIIRLTATHAHHHPTYYPDQHNTLPTPRSQNLYRLIIAV